MFPDEPTNPLEDLKQGQARIMATLSQLARNQQLQAHAMTAMSQAISTLGDALTAIALPKRIIRDDMGKIVALEPMADGEE